MRWEEQVHLGKRTRLRTEGRITLKTVTFFSRNVTECFFIALYICIFKPICVIVSARNYTVFIT